MQIPAQVSKTSRTVNSHSIQATAATLSAADGVQIYAATWLPPKPIAAVVLVHGLAEHCGRYAAFARYLHQHQIALFTFDLRGHGQSQNAKLGKKSGRIIINKFSDYMTDVQAAIDHAHSKLENTPIFLMGHSMGGLIAAHYIANLSVDRQAKFAGLIVSSGALKVGKSVSPLKIKIGRLISNWMPFKAVAKLDNSTLSRDPAVLQKVQDDPWHFKGSVPARTGAELIGAMQNLPQKTHNLLVPLLMFHGTADRLTEPAGTQMIFEQAGALDKTLKLYEGSYHETLNDLDREHVMGDILAWVLQHSFGAQKAQI